MNEQELKEIIISALEHVNHHVRYMYQVQGFFLAMCDVLEEYFPGFRAKVKAHKSAPVDPSLTYSTEKQSEILDELIRKMRA